MSILYNPIGIIFTPYKTKEGIPIQSSLAKGIKGRIEINEEFVPGLLDLDGFSHIILIYHFHNSAGFDLQTKPFLDDEKHGIFSIRAPKRPNPIGISVVRLLGIHGNILDIENVDMMNGTPLLDIKPYIAEFDIHTIERSGWIAHKLNTLGRMKSDNRFE